MPRWVYWVPLKVCPLLDILDILHPARMAILHQAIHLDILHSGIHPRLALVDTHREASQDTRHLDTHHHLAIHLRQVAILMATTIHRDPTHHLQATLVASLQR